MENISQSKNINVSNILSASRIAVAPLLIIFSVMNMITVFLILFGYVILSDLLDGYIARKTDNITDLGARLDAAGDFATLPAVLISGWLLWPDLVWQELSFLLLAALAYVIPLIVAQLKYGTVPAYRALSRKAGVLLIAVGSLYMFMTGNPIWLRTGVVVEVLAAIDSLAITLMLSEPHDNVPSVMAAIRIRKTLEEAQ